MLKKIFFVSGGTLLFLIGCVLYGVILNLRNEPLSEIMKKKDIKELENVHLQVNKSKYSLILYSDTIEVKTYRAVFGRNNKPRKKAIDKSTPIGEYAVCSIDSNFKYHRFIRINYPNVNDASEALRSGVISKKEFEKIKFDFFYSDCVTDSTQLGGNIGIHGIGQLNFVFKNLPFVYNWTDGSIAISNEDIDEILPYVKKGTKIVITQ